MSQKTYGILIAFIGASLWGVSGNVAEYIFLYSKLPSLTYVMLRMLFTGIILLSYGYYLGYGKDVKKIFSNIRNIRNIILYAFIGIMGLQTSFGETIKYSNAPFATLIQFLAPLIILIYLSILNKKMPKLSEIFFIILSLVGMFFMITNGSINSFKVAPIAIILGFISVLTFVFYILFIEKLFKYHTSIVIGLGMIIGSSFLMPLIDFTNIYRHLSLDILLALSFNILFGNVIPFYFFIESTRYISPTVTSLIGAFEPLTALLIGIYFMDNRLSNLQIIGGIIIIISVTILSIQDKKTSH